MSQPDAPEILDVTEPHNFLERLVGALRLDAKIYAEVEQDPDATGQAAGVVILTAIAAGFGAPDTGLEGVIGSVFGSLLGWLVSTWLIWVIGVQWMKHTSNYPELLRTLGFASAPQIVMVFGLVANAEWVVIVAALWSLAAYVIAVRAALDVTTGRAIGVCLISFGLKVFTMAVLLMLTGGLGGS
jgi:hypothetical protein